VARVDEYGGLRVEAAPTVAVDVFMGTALSATAG
jgi:hypothetical protein